jgi:23S rRNA (cytidine1920-2'-O)/16S rRNA (cytidine1409-2'-O)-methyltransferase
VRGLNERYVSKGGYKLEGAIGAFGVDVLGKPCIDAGACTGGFTDCLLKHGAALVYAVDAGFGQLAGSLAQHLKVVNLERTNLGDKKLLTLNPVPMLGSVDLSYLSLLKAVPQFRRVMHGQGELLCLVKPLFEVDDSLARRKGEIRKEDYTPTLLRLIAGLSGQEGTRVCGVTHSPVTGTGGTYEFFLHVRFGEVRQNSGCWEEAVRRAVEKALALPRYRR